MTFGTHKLVHSQPFLEYRYEIWYCCLRYIATYIALYSHFSDYHLPTKMRNVQCVWKGNPFWKNAENFVEIGLWTATQCLFELCTPRTHGDTDSERDKQTKKTSHFRTYSRRALCNIPQTLHGDRASRGHQKGATDFLDPTHSFPTRCTEKFGPIYRRAVSPQ